MEMVVVFISVLSRQNLQCESALTLKVISLWRHSGSVCHWAPTKHSSCSLASKNYRLCCAAFQGLLIEFGARRLIKWNKWIWNLNLSLMVQL